MKTLLVTLEQDIDANDRGWGAHAVGSVHFQNRTGVDLPEGVTIEVQEFKPGLWATRSGPRTPGAPGLIRAIPEAHYEREA
jgi:hypothetical protein